MLSADDITLMFFIGVDCYLVANLLTWEEDWRTVGAIIPIILGLSFIDLAVWAVVLS